MPINWSWKSDYYSDVEIDPNNTTPAVPGVPDESEDIGDITTMALERSKVQAARLRDEIEAIMQGDVAVIERALQKAQIESFIRTTAVEVCLRVADLAPHEPVPDEVQEAARSVRTFLGVQR